MDSIMLKFDIWNNYNLTNKMFFINDYQLKIILCAFKLGSLNSFESKHSFELSMQNDISQANSNI